MSERKNILKSFLQTHMRHSLDVALVLAQLDIFFSRGERGCYTLSPEGAIPESAVAEATAAITGMPVKGVITFTRADLRPREPHADRAPCFGVTELEKRLGTISKVTLWDRYAAPLEREMGRDSFHAMSEAFMQSLGEPVWHSFECASWKDFGYDLKLGVRAFILMALLMYIGHALSGPSKETKELSAFLSVLQHYIPYGRATDDEGLLLLIVD